VRIPLETQLVRALEKARELPMSALVRTVVGARAGEAKSAALALVRGGRAALIKDGRSERLLWPDARTLSSDETSAVVSAATRLAAIVKRLQTMLRGVKPTRARASYAVLRNDAGDVAREIREVAEAMDPSGSDPSASESVQTSPEAPARPKHDGDRMRALVMQAAEQLVMEGLGLVYVPELVHALGHEIVRDDVHHALRDAASRGELELRPESGLDRLSAEDRAACLVGPSGQLVSYVRMR
jgi:hypothetical protein